MKRFSDIINLNEHNSQARDVETTMLFQHRGEFVNSLATVHESRKTCLSRLNEHRGQPDPKKVRERQEAHERGEKRRKNAQQRRKQEQKLALQRQRQKNASQKEYDFKEHQEELSEIPVSERLQQIKKQKQEQNHQKQKIQSQQKKEQLQTSVNEQEALLDQETTDIIATAPTDTAKTSVENLTKDVKEINEQIKSDLESDLKDKSDTEKQEIRTKKKKEIEDKYNKALEKAEKEMKTSEEKSWMDSSAKKVFDRAKKVFDAWWELFGFKAITDPVKEVGQKYLGLKFEVSSDGKNSAKKEMMLKKKKELQAKKVAEELGKNKEERIKELQKQGYSRSEAQDILSDVMEKRTNKAIQDYDPDEDDDDQDFDEYQQKQQKKQKPKEKKNYNPNDIESLRKLATTAESKKLLNDRKNKRNSIVSQYRKEGLSHASAMNRWYNETKNMLS